MRRTSRPVSSCLLGAGTDIGLDQDFPYHAAPLPRVANRKTYAMIKTLGNWLDGARRIAVAPLAKHSPLRNEIRKWKKQWSRRRRHRHVDVCVISYPKCGRTWLRVLLGKALCDKFRLDEQRILNTWELTKAAGVLRTEFTHDGAEHQELRRYDELTTNKREYRNIKVIS